MFGSTQAILILPACLSIGMSYFNSRSIIRAVRYGQRWAVEAPKGRQRQAPAVLGHLLAERQGGRALNWL